MTTIKGFLGRQWANIAILMFAFLMFALTAGYISIPDISMTKQELFAPKNSLVESTVVDCWHTTVKKSYKKGEVTDLNQECLGNNTWLNRNTGKTYPGGNR